MHADYAFFGARPQLCAIPIQKDCCQSRARDDADRGGPARLGDNHRVCSALGELLHQLGDVDCLNHGGHASRDVGSGEHVLRLIVASKLEHIVEEARWNATATKPQTTPTASVSAKRCCDSFGR
jgi:hypothetical protein